MFWFGMFPKLRKMWIYPEISLVICIYLEISLVICPQQTNRSLQPARTRYDHVENLAMWESKHAQRNVTCLSWISGKNGEIPTTPRAIC